VDINRVWESTGE